MNPLVWTGELQNLSTDELAEDESRRTETVTSVQGEIPGMVTVLWSSLIQNFVNSGIIFIYIITITQRIDIDRRVVSSFSPP